MDLLYLILSNEEEGGEVLVSYLMPRMWEELDRRRRAKALRGTGQEEGAEVDGGEDPGGYP